MFANEWRHHAISGVKQGITDIGIRKQRVAALTSRLTVGAIQGARFPYLHIRREH